MTVGLTSNPMLVTRRIEEVAGIRPVTLLIASGIALIIVILMVTGIAANHLRRQALTAAESDLVRVDSVLAEASKRSFEVVGGRLDEIAAHIGPTTAASLPAAGAAPEIGDLMRHELGLVPAIDAVALIGADGSLLNSAGNWPADGRIGQSIAADLRAEPIKRVVIATPVSAGRADIPLVHRIVDASGATAGAIVALVPAENFTSFFAAVPLAHDAVVSLLQPDGSVLARYPGETGGQSAGATRDPRFGDITTTLVRHFTGENGQWQIEALHPLGSYPAALSVRRGADLVLAEWANQGLWFGGFAVILAIAIGIMVFLIARQFQTHATLAEMRADKIEAEKVEAERARLAAEAELLKKERLSVLGQLTATVAHELRNPLSAIRNTLFTVKELSTGAGIKLDRPLSRMERSIERCDRIISDLLEYTRQRELKRNTVRFDRWLADLLAEQSVAPPITLTSEFGAGEVAAPIDPDRFRRVIINLIENAAQALAETPPEREKRIAVRTALVDRNLIVVVEDTGPGIKPENLSRIFEPLFSTKTFGTGLGLPTVKQIVNQHDGIIDVASEIGSGTCVTVKLPLPGQETNVVRAAA